MKSARLRIGLLVLLAVTPGVLGGEAPPATAPSVGAMLQSGIYQEETVGNLDAAARIYQQILADAQSNRAFAAQAAYRLGMIQFKQKKTQEAIATLTKLTTDYPEQSDLVAKAGGALASARSNMSDNDLKAVVDAAVEKVSTMAETDPQLPPTLATLNGLDGKRVSADLAGWFSTGTPEERRAAIYILWRGPMSNEEVAGAIPGLAQLLKNGEDLTRGMAALALGQRKASETYGALAEMTLHDESPFARRCAAYALGLLGDPKAKPVLEQAARDKDQFVAGNARAAITMIAIGGGASGDVDKRPAADLAALGWKRWFARDYAAAEDLFQKSVAKDPRSANAWNGLGWSQFNQGKVETAKVAFEKAVVLDAKAAASWNGLGWIAKNGGNEEEAIANWTKAYDASPNATAAISGLASTYAEKGDYDRAIVWYNRWLKAEPASEDAKAGLEKAMKAKADKK
ncbi:MAG: tetratricopeptide repeat protein [Phycisphaerae bacterium]